MPNMDQIPTVTREQILQELAAIGFAKATDYWKVENDRLHEAYAIPSAFSAYTKYL